MPPPSWPTPSSHSENLSADQRPEWRQHQRGKEAGKVVDYCQESRVNVGMWLTRNTTLRSHAQGVVEMFWGLLALLLELDQELFQVKGRALGIRDNCVREAMRSGKSGVSNGTRHEGKSAHPNRIHRGEARWSKIKGSDRMSAKLQHRKSVDPEATAGVCKCFERSSDGHGRCKHLRSRRQHHVGPEPASMMGSRGGTGPTD